jgi:hypothetical protein
MGQAKNIKKKCRILLLGLILTCYLQESNRDKESDDFISIKGLKKAQNRSKQKNLDSLKEESNKLKKLESEELLQEVKDDKECENYKIVIGYKCNSCFSYVLEEQKDLHPTNHQLERVLLGIRFECPKCNKLYIGNGDIFCPKCKAKLKSIIVEIEKKEGDYYNQKTGKKICRRGEEILDVVSEDEKEKDGKDSAGSESDNAQNKPPKNSKNVKGEVRYEE